MEALKDFSVVTLLVREFSRQKVSDQVRLKSGLEELVRSAIAPLPAAGRVVIDVPDGFVIVVLGGPQAALDIAEAAEARAGTLQLCVGLNHGPVKAAQPGGELVGDGLLASLTVAKLATRGRLLASRSFRDALAHGAPHRAAALASVGAFDDASFRKHELFTPEPRLAASRRRGLLLFFALAGIGLLGTGAGIRALRTRSKRPALISFDITPQGVIYVNGEMKGVSPPLRQLELAPGEHTIEVRNVPHPPLKLEITVSPAQEMTITHAFAAAKRPRVREESFVDRLRRKLGL